MAIVRRREDESGLTRARGLDPFEMMRELLGWAPLAEMGRLGTAETGYLPSFDVKETKDAYIFKADLPGIKEENLEVALTGNRLTINGKREEEQREEGERYYTVERSYGAFTRSFTLPEGIDSDHVEAELKHGVLSVSVPKTPEVQPKRVLIKGKGASDKGVKA